MKKISTQHICVSAMECFLHKKYSPNYFSRTLLVTLHTGAVVMRYCNSQLRFVFVRAFLTGPLLFQ